MQSVARRGRHTGGPTRQDSPWLAVFCAALTCIALAGIVAVAESPRSLSDTSRRPASAGSAAAAAALYKGYA
jgi:hypothetical protein